MKKILMAAILAVSFLISMPQVSAELVYAGYSKKATLYINDILRENVTFNYYIDTSRIEGMSVGSDHVYGISVPLVAKAVEYNYQKDGGSESYIFRNGQWWSSGPAIVDRNGVFHDGNYHAGTRNAEDKAIWQTVQPYCQDLKKSIENGMNTRAQKQEQTKSEVAPLVEEADAKYKAKKYAEAKELFSQAVSKYPHDYHTHDLFARSMYHEKSKDKDYDKIIAESKKAIELAPDNESKADCYSFLGKVYRKLAMNNLFNTDNKTDYVALGQHCVDMANKLRMAK